MAEKPFLIVSDLHLGAVPDSTERAFRAFLDMAATSASGLLINGDLFEFGMAYRYVMNRHHVRTLAKLADVVDAGVPVYFLGGNHDYVEWSGPLLRDVGVTLLPDGVTMELAGRRARIVHGDEVCLGRPSKERWIGRSRPVVALLRSIHPDLAGWFQPYTTGTRRQLDRLAAGHGGGPKHHAPHIEAWARSELERDRSLDLVVAGHSHLPAHVEVEPGRFYLNAGDWLSHFTYLRLPAPPEPPELHRWRDGKTERVT